MAALVRPEALVTDPKPVTRTLLLEIRDPVAGVVEVYSPSDEEMLEMGFVRVGNGNVFDPTAIPDIPDLVVGNGRANGEEKA